MKLLSPEEICEECKGLDHCDLVNSEEREEKCERYRHVKLGASNQLRKNAEWLVERMKDYFISVGTVKFTPKEFEDLKKSVQK